MKLLLDTHIWVWSQANPKRLSARVLREIESLENEVWLSPISLWELLILVEKGRLALDADPREWIAKAFDAMSLREAPINSEVAIQSRLVAWRHQDPADRFLAATALVYELTLVTADERLLRARGIPFLANR